MNEFRELAKQKKMEMEGSDKSETSQSSEEEEDVVLRLRDSFKADYEVKDVAEDSSYLYSNGLHSLMDYSNNDSHITS